VIKDLLYPDETAAENGLGWDDDDLKQMYTDLSKDSKKRIKLQSIYDSKTLKPNGKKTWLA
jgi:hypothetical protein